MLCSKYWGGGTKRKKTIWGVRKQKELREGGRKKLGKGGDGEVKETKRIGEGRKKIGEGRKQRD